MGASNFLPTSGITSGGTSLLSKINWSTLLSNTQKTLNVVNQAVPLYYQIKPVFKNMKTISKIGKEFSKIGNNNITNDNSNKIEPSQDNLTNYSKNNITESNYEVPSPTFFI